MAFFPAITCILAAGISGSFARYLSLGGIASFVGDGGLSYTQEKNLETFYKWHINDYLEMTADYQLMINPGYNLVRGPINLFGLRLRAEFWHVINRKKLGRSRPAKRDR